MVHGTEAWLYNTKTRKLIYVVADETIKDKDDLISVVENNYGSMGAEVAKEEIFAIETGDHFS